MRVFVRDTVGSHDTIKSTCVRGLDGVVDRSVTSDFTFRVRVPGLFFQMGSLRSEVRLRVSESVIRTDGRLVPWYGRTGFRVHRSGGHLVRVCPKGLETQPTDHFPKGFVSVRRL